LTDLANQANYCHEKENHFDTEPPTVEQLGQTQVNALIRELCGKLREYEDRLAASSRNSSKSPSSDSPAARAERKKLQCLAAQIRLALNLGTRGIDDH